MTLLDAIDGCSTGLPAAGAPPSWPLPSWAAAPWVAPLWAGRNLGAAARGPLTGDLGEMVWWLMIAAALIAVLGGALYVVSRILHQREHDSHPALFAGLCRLHRLGGTSRSLLAQIARAHGLAHPARLFLEPEWFEPSRLPPPLAARSAEVVALRRRLFGEAP